MSEHTYKLIELVGSSPISSDEAIKNAIAKAAKTVKHMKWCGKMRKKALPHCVLAVVWAWPWPWKDRLHKQDKSVKVTWQVR